MDLYLDKFVEVIEMINSPDWWTIVLTIINIIAFVLVAYTQIKQQKYQTKLQEKQAQQQEYELYRRMYSQVFKLDFFIKTVLFKIVAILTSNEDNKLRLKLIGDILDECDKQFEEFSECTIDMELKRCGEGADAKCYYDALHASRKVIVFFKYFIEEALLGFEPSLENKISMEYTPPPEKLIGVIMQLFKGRNPHYLRDELFKFTTIVEKTDKSQLLEIIKARITSTYTR